MRFELPWPPSINRYYRHVGFRTLISREGRAFRRNVCALLAGGRGPMVVGRLALCMDAFPPDRRVRDLDNIQKPVLDAMQHAGVYRDDSQVDLLVTRRCRLRESGRLLIRLDEMPLARCPLCGGPYDEPGMEKD